MCLVNTKAINIEHGYGYKIVLLGLAAKKKGWGNIEMWYKKGFRYTAYYGSMFFKKNVWYKAESCPVKRMILDYAPGFHIYTDFKEVKKFHCLDTSVIVKVEFRNAYIKGKDLSARRAKSIVAEEIRIIEEIKQ